MFRTRRDILGLGATLAAGTLLPSLASAQAAQSATGSASAKAAKPMKI